MAESFWYSFTSWRLAMVSITPMANPAIAMATDSSNTWLHSGMKANTSEMTRVQEKRATSEDWSLEDTEREDHIHSRRQKFKPPEAASHQQEELLGEEDPRDLLQRGMGLTPQVQDRGSQEGDAQAEAEERAPVDELGLPNGCRLLTYTAELYRADSTSIPSVSNLAETKKKVGQFELALVVDEQVLRLQVSVEDFPLVTVGQTTQQLEHENLPEGGPFEPLLPYLNGETSVLGLVGEVEMLSWFICSVNSFSSMVSVRGTERENRLLKFFILFMVLGGPRLWEKK
ncbi:hypothetical protein EYF80_043763 [Liparis tanakae]|uniref:Uncharacterized protein n=1 Tax=Liparis tanakae TaxID=230148 RepID=A0A4Z2FYP8_9TELE|nr:hypothetical protein EYF80_043763 [Liparis tanakae]